MLKLWGEKHLAIGNKPPVWGGRPRPPPLQLSLIWLIPKFEV